MADPTSNTDQEKFRRLQELLFEEDRAVTRQIQEEVETLREQVISPEEVKVRVEPFIENKIEFLQENFPELFGPVLAETIKKQIRDSQDEMIDALYPIIGKLIRKFISKEIERLVEQMDRSINDAFSWEGWRRRVRGWFRGERESDRVIRDLAQADLQQAFIIDKESGLLAGTWARTEMVDEDLVAGMLTAIKGFVESAFQGGAQELETIAYDNFKILLHNFQTHYIAVVVSGVVTTEFRDRLNNTLMAFAENYRVYTRDELDEVAVRKNSEALKKHLDGLHADHQ